MTVLPSTLTKDPFLHCPLAAHCPCISGTGQGPSPTWEAGRRAVGTTLCGRPGLRVISRRRCQPYWGPVNYEFRKWKEPSPVRKWYSLRDGTEAVPYQ